jgi:hypothetical protein
MNKQETTIFYVEIATSISQNYQFNDKPQSNPFTKPSSP